MAVGGGLTNSCEKIEAKSKGEKERYTYLNAEVQRIARRDKKAFLRDQYKENRGKQQNGKDQSSLQENQRYQGNISFKDGHNKGQKWYGPNRSRDSTKRWQEYTEELYKEDIHNPDNNDIVQEAVIKTMPKKKKCKKAKWLSEEALQIAEKKEK